MEQELEQVQDGGEGRDNACSLRGAGDRRGGNLTRSREKDGAGGRAEARSKGGDSTGMLVEQHLAGRQDNARTTVISTHCSKWTRNNF